jgi:uncharacterized protein (UPF0147 family)
MMAKEKAKLETTLESIFHDTVVKKNGAAAGSEATENRMNELKLLELAVAES